MRGHAGASLGGMTIRRLPLPKHVRGVYLWAGSATVALQRAKFPDIPVDEKAHLHAHSCAAARELQRCGINLAFLSMNWGFPPEIEKAHWSEFEEAVRVYADAGIAVLGYVQSSNCLRVGSYAGKDWFAQDPDGRTIPYFRNRLMTCWNHPAWRAQVAERARQVVRAGATGVFFDNVWMGGTPWTLGGPVSGFAGCACARCHSAYRKRSGAPIPTRLRDDEATQTFLYWRAQIINECLTEWRQAVQQEDRDAIVLANNCDVGLRDTIGLFGLDPALLAGAQDALLLENVAMPAFTGKRLIANAIPLKALQALAPGKSVVSVAYERGIGLDGPPALQRVRRFIAEVKAVGAAPVLKGSEYLDARGWFSLITAPAFDQVRESAGQMLNWFAQHESLFEGCTPSPSVLVPIPERVTGRFWNQTMPAALLTGLALVRAQVPFAFATSTNKEHGSVPVITPFARWHRPQALAHNAVARQVFNGPMQSLSRAYFGNAHMRRSLDASGITARFLQSPFFNLPPDWSQILRCLPPVDMPASSDQAVLVERWRRNPHTTLLHLVNYSETAARVRLHGVTGVSVRLFTPDDNTGWTGAPGELRLDTYATVELTPG